MNIIPFLKQMLTRFGACEEKDEGSKNWPLFGGNVQKGSRTIERTVVWCLFDCVCVCEGVKGGLVCFFLRLK